MNIIADAKSINELTPGSFSQENPLVEILKEAIELRKQPSHIPLATKDQPTGYIR